MQAPKPIEWTPGWLSQVIFLLLGIYATFISDQLDIGMIMTTASVVIGVMRQLTREILSRLPEKDL